MDFDIHQDDNKYSKLLFLLYFIPVIIFFKGENNIELASREKEILTMIAQGKDNHKISKELEISLHTVNVFVNNIFKKLNVNDRKQAIIIGIYNNLIDI